MAGSLYDIVIVGGGMVGNAFALCCAKSRYLSKCRILLVEAGKATKLPQVLGEYSNRVSALNPSTKRLFSKLDVWKTIRQYRHGVVRRLYVWETCSESSISFENRQDKDKPDDIAYIVENNLVSSSLADAVAETATVDICFESAIKHISLPGSREKLVDCELSDGTKLQTKLIVGADGFNSLIRKQMGVSTLTWNYDQKAVVATLSVEPVCEASENTTAWQRFTPNGPVALLPLSPSQSSLVWTTTPEKADRLVTISAEKFVMELNETLNETYSQDLLTNTVLDIFRDVGKRICLGDNLSENLPPYVATVSENSRASFPLGFCHASDYIAPRVALIGDAAHRVHPLAGQGVNLGFGDASCLAETLDNAVLDGRDIGSVDVLSRYDCQRQAHNVPAMFTIDWLNRLYSTASAPVVFARSLGLSIVDVAVPLKNLIISRASV